MISALLDWRQRAGRSWKEKLQIAWMTGADENDPRGSALRRIRNHLRSGLVDYSQKMTVAAMQMADMNVWAQRS